MIRDTPHGRALGHSGFFPGYLSEMRYYTSHKFAVALQVNTSDRRRMRRSPGAILDRLAAVVLAALPASSKK